MTVAVEPVTIIIPHYNDVDRLRRCLRALSPQIAAGDEIIVADNASDADMSAVMEEFPRVDFIVVDEKGAGPARNAGVARARNATLLFIDADCVARDDWVATGRRMARPNALIGGRVDIFHETAPPLSGAEAFEAVFALNMKRYAEKVGFLGAGNLVVERDTFDKVGGFRPAISEDKEWSMRARAIGVELSYSDDLVVSHPSRQDWAALSRKWQRLVTEEFLLRAQRNGSRLTWAIRALAMPASAFIHMPRVFLSPDMTLPEKLRGSITLVRLRVQRMTHMLSQSLTGRA